MASYLFNIWHAVGCFSLTMFVALSLFVPEIFEPIATRLAGSRMSSYLTYLWDGEERAEEGRAEAETGAGSAAAGGEGVTEGRLEGQLAGAEAGQGCPQARVEMAAEWQLTQTALRVRFNRALLLLLIATQLLLPLRSYLTVEFLTNPGQQVWSGQSELFSWWLRIGRKNCRSFELRAINPHRLKGGPLNLTLMLSSTFHSSAYYMFPQLTLNEANLLAACRRAPALAAYSRRAYQLVEGMPSNLFGPTESMRIVTTTYCLLFTTHY